MTLDNPGRRDISLPRLPCHAPYTCINHLYPLSQARIMCILILIDFKSLGYATTLYNTLIPEPILIFLNNSEVATYTIYNAW